MQKPIIAIHKKNKNRQNKYFPYCVGQTSHAGYYRKKRNIYMYTIYFVLI